MTLVGPYLAACALLVVAGALKAVRPGDTARALALAVPPASRPMVHLVRVGASVECALGVVGLVRPSTAVAAAVAASYAGFAGFVLLARRRGGVLATCGCFGTADTPPTWLHVVLNVGLAASAVAVAASSPAGWLPRLLAAQPAHGIPLVLASALCAWLVFLALGPLARLAAVRRLVAPRGGPGR